MAGTTREPARAGGVLVVNGHRSSNRARPRHVASEPHQIWMGDETVGDVDGEVISRIARASLRHEEKVPGSVIGRSSLCDGAQGDKTACDRRGKQKPLYRYHYFSEALSALPQIYGEE
jgi:hypothetical protein